MYPYRLLAFPRAINSEMPWFSALVARDIPGFVDSRGDLVLVLRVSIDMI
jgi:hypothetical protein